MCDHTTSSLTTIEAPDHLQPGPAQATTTAAAAGSRRRRLWELPSHAFCPVVGVCLPISLLRRMIGKAVGPKAVSDDYELHCYVIALSKTRNAISERLQRELERRYASARLQATQLKTGQALGQWWTVSQHGNDVAGALWATLTHARCDTLLEERVLNDIHMLQHQVGAANRADIQRCAELLHENGVLTRELGAIQVRTSRLIAEKSTRISQLAGENMQLRGALIGKDTQAAELHEQIATLKTGFPGLQTRLEQAHHIDMQLNRIHALERQVLQLQQHNHAMEERLALANTVTAPPAQAEAPDSLQPAAAGIRDKSVLCVGGRPAIVPVYRQLIERIGGHFLHHDGGKEESASRLEASLAAADLVICQTGCVSHGAYWRVKDHCKRTGKPCLFVEKPSASSMERCLKGLGQTAPDSMHAQPATERPASPCVTACERGEED